MESSGMGQLKGFNLMANNNIFDVKSEALLRSVIMPKLSYILEPILTLISTEDEDIRKAAVKTNNLLL